MSCVCVGSVNSRVVSTEGEERSPSGQLWGGSHITPSIPPSPVFSATSQSVLICYSQHVLLYTLFLC